MSANRWLSGAAQAVASFRYTPLPCRVTYICLTVGFLIFLLTNDTVLEALVLVPFRLLPPNFWLWTVFTFWSVETNVFLLISHFVCVHISGVVLLQAIWDWREWLRYFILTNIIPALAAVGISIFMYALPITNSESWYFFNEHSAYNIHGLAAFDGALFVAVKQALPDTVLFQTSWLGRFKNSHLPFTAVVLGIFVTAFRLLSSVYLIQFIVGLYTGWVYLRFYQKHSNAGVPRGDPSENFSFANFFPSILQPPVSVCGGVFYRIALRLRIIKPSIRRFVDVGGLGSGSHLQSVVTQPTASQLDAERRRQKALRDLNERLAKTKDQTSQPAAAWPSLMDDEDEQPISAPHRSSGPDQSGAKPENVSKEKSVSSAALEAGSAQSASSSGNKSAEATLLLHDDV